MGVSIENSRYLSRADLLRDCSANVKFLSCEPLLGSLIDLSLHKIDWVIAGGESGPKARPMKPEWVNQLRDKCTNDDVAFFFKQWGGVNKKRTGRMLDGRTWDDFPQDLPGSVRSLPLFA